jgi:hypothetical protein
MMLYGVSLVFNSLGNVLGLMSGRRVGFQSTEAFGSLHHAGGGPAHCHRGISPSLHVATDSGARSPSWLFWCALLSRPDVWAYLAATVAMSRAANSEMMPWRL